MGILKKQLLQLAASGLLMSLAWSLRGQFGHLKGAMIPGAVAAAIPPLIFRGRWSASTALALVLSVAGFSLGGHMSYGRLFETVEFSTLSQSFPQLLKILLIGGVWGGLGTTFLGFGLSEKNFTRADLALLITSLVLLFILLGILNLESLDVAIYCAAFLILHLYNLLVKKSWLVFGFGMGGALGFAAATLTTLAFVPQVLKSWRRRAVDDLSLGMLVALNVGIVLWIAYGLAIAAFPLVFANVVTLVFTAILLGLKIGVRPRQG